MAIKLFTIFFFILDDVILMTLVGVGIQSTDGCYELGDSLHELSGATIDLEDCLFSCLVSQ